MQGQQSDIAYETAYLNGIEAVQTPVEQASTRAIRFPRFRRAVYRFVKRAFDLITSVALLLVIWPVMAVIAIQIKRSSEGPVLYKHKRIGQYGNDLYLWKFRSMVINAEELVKQFTPEQKKEWEENFKLKNDPRITKIGAFLRRTSLDELPQLFNIIKGDLSVIGPRPVIEDEIEKYGFSKTRFLSVKPGLTGYWQVSGRSNVTYEDRMQLELYYVDHASTALDLKILKQSFGVVFHRKGAV